MELATVLIHHSPRTFLTGSPFIRLPKKTPRASTLARQVPSATFEEEVTSIAVLTCCMPR
jgi:hypothetical protein